MSIVSLQKFRSKEFWLKNIVYILLVLVFIVFGIVNPKFLSGENILSFFSQSCTTLLVGIGMALCMLTRGVDLSVGSTMYMVAVTIWLTMKANPDVPIGVLALLGIAVGLAIGLLNGFVVAKLKIYGLLPTMATMYIFRGVGRAAAGETMCFMSQQWQAIVAPKLLNIPVFIYVTIALMIIAQIFLSRTKLGRHIHATGDNERMAVEKNIHIFRVKLFVYTASGFFAALAGILTSSMTMTASYGTGDGMEFKVITAAVLGGVSLNGGHGTVLPGILAGAFILTFISNALVLMKANTYLYYIVYSLVIFVFVLIDTVRVRSEARYT